jgi:hypothetical protein
MQISFGYSLKTLFLILLISVLLPNLSFTTENKFPDDLQQWIPWVLYEQEEETCTIDTGSIDKRYCTWPSSLKLDVKPDAATFTQIWLIETRSLVPLPGNSPFWPENVQSNGKDILVSKYQDHPAVWLDPGKHKITGSFTWKTLPENLLIPAKTGFVALTLAGKKVKNLQLDQQGRLWFRQQQKTTKDTQNSLDIQVFRKIKDGVPLIQELFIQLTVSGNPRQITLGLVNEDPFIPLELYSQLPARLDNNGRLQLQARPGQWQVRLKLRNSTPLSPEK